MSFQDGSAGVCLQWQCHSFKKQSFEDSFGRYLPSRWFRWLSIFPAALSAAGDDIRAARVMRWEAETFWLDNWVVFKPRTLVGVMSRFEDERLKDWKSLRSQNLWGPKSMIFKSCRCQARVRSYLQWGWSFDLPKSWQAMVSVMLKMILFCTEWYFSLILMTYDSFYHALQVSWHSCLHSKSVIFDPSFYWFAAASINLTAIRSCSLTLLELGFWFVPRCPFESF